MHRRTFVRNLGAALVAPPALRALTGIGPAKRLKRIGIQLYTLRDAARVSLERTLANIAAAGYNDVELLASMDNFGMPAARVRQMLDRYHLRAPSTHVTVRALDGMQRQLADAQTLGHEYLIVAGLPESQRQSLDDYRGWADRLNRAGEMARKAGVWIGFHNHADDFEVLEGRVAYDVLVEHTDPSLVRHQLDTGNLAMSGRDPLAYMERFGNRYWSFHIKDVALLGAKSDVELGTGVIDFERLLARTQNVGDKHFFVEQESYPGDPLNSARRDHAYLATLDF